MLPKLIRKCRDALLDSADHVTHRGGLVDHKDDIDRDSIALRDEIERKNLSLDPILQDKEIFFLERPNELVVIVDRGEDDAHGWEMCDIDILDFEQHISFHRL